MLIQGILHKQADLVIKLECSLGQFSIYDTRLQSLPDGLHDGLFELIQIRANMQQGSNEQGLPVLTLESIAELKAYALFAAPLQENVPNESILPQANQQKVKPEPSLKDDPADKELFGELWPLGNRVKLDETHPKFREQVKRMNEFKAQKLYSYIGGEDKVWVKLNP